MRYEKAVFQPGSSKKQKIEQTAGSAAGFPAIRGEGGWLAVIWLYITLKGVMGFSYHSSEI